LRKHNNNKQPKGLLLKTVRRIDWLREESS